MAKVTSTRTTLEFTEMAKITVLLLGSTSTSVQDVEKRDQIMVIVTKI